MLFDLKIMVLNFQKVKSLSHSALLRGRARGDEKLSLLYPAEFVLLGPVAGDRGFCGLGRVMEATERGELGSGIGANKFGTPWIQEALEYGSG